LDTELSYSKAVKESYLSATGYTLEEDPKSFTDTGYVARKNMFDNSNVVQLIHKLDCDIFNQVYFFQF